MITDDRYNLLPDSDEENSEEQKPIKSRWYAIQVASGCEKKVKASLLQRALTMGVSENILSIEIPQTPVVRLKKDGSRQQIDEKIFPGYVLLRVRWRKMPSPASGKLAMKLGRWSKQLPMSSTLWAPSKNGLRGWVEAVAT